MGREIRPAVPSLQGGRRQHSMTKRLSNKRKLNLFQYRGKFLYLNGIRFERRDQERLIEQAAQRALHAASASARRATQVQASMTDMSTAKKSPRRIQHRNHLASAALRSCFQSAEISTAEY